MKAGRPVRTLIQLLDRLASQLPLIVVLQCVVDVGLVDSNDQGILAEERDYESHDVGPVCIQVRIPVANLLRVLSPKPELEIRLHDRAHCAILRDSR